MDPGPYEDPEFLEILAYQAASIERWIRAHAASDTEDALSSDTEDALSRILLGTTRQPRHEAYSRLVDGSVIIVMSAGMIDLVREATKAVLLASKPIPPIEGTSSGFREGPETTREALESSPVLRNVLYDKFATWLYDGVPRSAQSPAVSPVYASPLKLLVDGAERFLLAHEYGHALMDYLQPINPGEGPATDGSEWDQEFQADAFGFNVVAASSDAIDALPAYMALRGATVVVKVHEIFHSAQNIAWTGHQHADWTSESHPPFEERLAALEKWYVDEHPDNGDPFDHVRDITLPGETLDVVWEWVSPRLTSDFEHGRQVHPIWK